MIPRHPSLLASFVLALALFGVAPQATAEDTDVWERYFATGEPEAAGLQADETAGPPWSRWLALNGVLLLALGLGLWLVRSGRLAAWLRRRRGRRAEAPALVVEASADLAQGQTVHLVRGEGFRILVGSWSGGIVSLGQLPAGSAAAAVPDEAPSIEEPAGILERRPRENDPSIAPVVSRRFATALFAAAAPSPEAPAPDPAPSDDQRALADQVMAQVRRLRGRGGALLVLLALAATALAIPELALAQDAAASATGPSLAGLLNPPDDPGWMENALVALGLLTVLALAPSLLITLTSFTRLVIVFAFLRQALGTQNTPPNQVLIGLALFLTLFVMSPVLTQIKAEAMDPYVAGEIEFEEALERGTPPLRDFMLRQTRMKDLELMVQHHGGERPQSREDVPMTLLIPAFMLSELQTAFIIGFLLYVPFLIIDLIISTILLAMGMMVLPPVVISLPFKILLFVLVDGWYLLVGSLLQGFA